MVLLGQKWFYSDKVVVFEQNGSISTKMDVLGQKWLSSSKSGCIRAKRVVIRQKWLY